jgi:hypothetical protein
MAPIEIAEKIEKMNDDEFRRHALTILERELGVYGLARFIRVYRTGTGDYTRDRHQWLDGLTVDDIVRGASHS